MAKIQNFAKENKRATDDLNESIEKLGGSMASLANLLTRFVKTSDDLDSTYAGIADKASDLIDSINDLGQSTRKAVDFTRDYRDLVFKLRDVIKDINNKSRTLNFVQSNSVKLNQDLVSLLNQQQTAYQANNHVLVNDLSRQIAKKNNLIVQNQQAEANLKYELSSLQAAEKKLRVRGNILKQLRSESKNLDSIDSVLKNSGLTLESMTDTISNGFRGLDNFIGRIPFLPDLFGTDVLTKNLKGNVQNAILGILKSGGSSLSALTSGISAGFSSISTAATGMFAALGPLLPLILAISGAFIAIKAALDMEKELVDLAFQLDVSKSTAAELKNIATDLANEIDVVGINYQKILDVNTQLLDIIPANLLMQARVNKSAKELLITSTLLIEKEKLAVDEVRELNSVATVFDTTLSGIVAVSTKLGDSFVTSKQILQEIAKVSKTILINMNQQPIALLKAIRKAKLLGTTIDEINSASHGLLDVESSIGAEMTANVLTGRSINLNRAREFALMGDVASLQDELLKQVGTYSDYMAMAPYQRKAIADAAGLEFNQLEAIMLKQKELENIGMSMAELERNSSLQGEARNRAMEEYLKMGNTAAAELLKQKYADQDRVANLDKLSAMGEKAMALFNKLLTPVLAIITPIFDVFVGIADVLIDTVSPIINSLVKSFNELFPGIKDSGKAFQDIGKIIAPLILLPLKGVLMVVSAIKEQIISVMEVFSGISDIFQGNFLDGIKKIGEGIFRFVIAPIQSIIDVVVQVANSLIPLVNKLGLDVKEIGPVNLTDKLFGTKRNVKVEGLATGGTVTASGTVLVGEQGPELLDLPKGAKVTSNKETVASLSESNNSELVSLIKELIRKIDQPVYVNIDGRVIDQLDKQVTLRRSFNTKTDFNFSNK